MSCVDSRQHECLKKSTLMLQDLSHDAVCCERHFGCFVLRLHAIRNPVRTDFLPFCKQANQCTIAQQPEVCDSHVLLVAAVIQLFHNGLEQAPSSF